MYNKRWVRSSRKPLDSSFSARGSPRHLSIADTSGSISAISKFISRLFQIFARLVWKVSIEQVRTKNFSSYFSHFRSTLETRTFSFHILARRRCVRLSACVFKKTFRKVSFSWERRTESKGNEKKRTRGSYT